MYNDERHILDQHRALLGDSVRTNAYAEAIGRVVGAGDVVLDLGSGSGVLAILACRAAIISSSSPRTSVAASP